MVAVPGDVVQGMEALVRMETFHYNLRRGIATRKVGFEQPKRVRTPRDFNLHKLLGRLVSLLQYERSKYLSLSRRSIDEGSSSIAVPLKKNQLILPDEISGSPFSFEQPERSSLVRNLKLNIPDGRLFRFLLPLRFKMTSLFRRGINVGFGVLAISLLQAAGIIWFNLL
ncbi:hypothetical protein CISIN_1g030953mg [Citrus sinensis]|uniref:Uncharacterized protein n=1 Tax=Citrus sinensis TaxID=2711 RepID=A0A067DHJ3_CITSI|nr:hypothetical protein CISIN_1g030953mg [Citrus sinensis]